MLPSRRAMNPVDLRIADNAVLTSTFESFAVTVPVTVLLARTLNPP
jgi:hypothetical protein